MMSDSLLCNLFDIQDMDIKDEVLAGKGMIKVKNHRVIPNRRNRHQLACWCIQDLPFLDFGWKIVLGHGDLFGVIVWAEPLVRSQDYLSRVAGLKPVQSLFQHGIHLSA